MAEAALPPVCVEGDSGTGDLLWCYYLFFNRLVSLNLCRLCAEEPATCRLKGSNTGVSTMIDEAAAGDGSCRCVGFFLKAVSRVASSKTGLHSTVLS